MKNPFSFLNKWKYANRMERDRIDLGFFADWSDRDIAIRFRVSSIMIFAFGFTWSISKYESYLCFFNYQIQLKKERKIKKEI
jgi:hypothetical protein